MITRSFTLRLAAGLAAALPGRAAADPLLSAWRTASSSQYAQVFQGSSASPESTWPQGLSGTIFGGQATPAYSDVQRVTYSSDYVYVNATGLASYTMGPWYQNAAKTILFQNWPADQGLIIRFPRSPAVAATPTTTSLGPIALAVNGVVFFNGQDAFSWSYSAQQDEQQPQGDGIWNRDAMDSESVTFDPSLAHQQNTGQYHYHVNPIGLRYQLGDHVSYANGAYSESTAAPTAHSPLLGYAFDGFPIYGPYGYSSPMDATSGVRRMVSGYVLRNGQYGTANLSLTGRTTLPAWAAAAEGRPGTSLTTDEQGPPVSTSRPLGYYQEDNDYLGDLGYVQGQDFDLNRYNARYCVTPDYPNGTWAYFVTITSTGAPAFPYTVGPQYEGVPSGGSVNAITETVTEYARGGAASPITVTATSAPTGALLSWTSVEGGVYSIQSSANGTTWTTIATNVASAGATTSYATTVASGYFQVTLTALAAYDTAGSGSVTAIGGTGSAQLVGASGTCYFTNLSALASVGGAAGSPIAGFYLSGAGAKPILVRAVGPTLAPLDGSISALADPEYTLYAASSPLEAVSGWAPSLSSVFAAVGAFALTPGSADAAAEFSLAPGGYTAVVSSVSGGSGSAQLELYDAGTAGASPVLINISARGFVSPSASLTGGFVIGGAGTTQVLVRGIGPALSGLGVSGALAEPELTLYQAQTTLASNTGWSTASNASAIAAAAAQVGAFSLTPGSADSALLVTLPPGEYTASVSGPPGASGNAMVEVYLVN